MPSSCSAFWQFAVLRSPQSALRSRVSTRRISVLSPALVSPFLLLALRAVAGEEVVNFARVPGLPCAPERDVVSIHARAEEASASAQRVPERGSPPEYADARTLSCPQTGGEAARTPILPPGFASLVG